MTAVRLGLSIGLVAALASLPAPDRGEEGPSSSQEMHRRRAAEPLSDRTLLQNILEEALNAAGRGDVVELSRYERALSVMNDAIYHSFRVDVQRSIDRAAEKGDSDSLVRAVTEQVVLSIRLLLEESHSSTGAMDLLPRVQQAVTNYELIREPLEKMEPEKAVRVRRAFHRLEVAMTGDMRRDLPLIREAEAALDAAVPGARSSSGLPSRGPSLPALCLRPH